MQTTLRWKYSISPARFFRVRQSGQDFFVLLNSSTSSIPATTYPPMVPSRNTRFFLVYRSAEPYQTYYSNSCNQKQQPAIFKPCTYKVHRNSNRQEPITLQLTIQSITLPVHEFTIISQFALFILSIWMKQCIFTYSAIFQSLWIKNASSEIFRTH